MLIDNKRNNKLGDVLKSHIKTNSNVSIVTNHFTIHAYEELKKELKKIKSIRVICSASNFKNDINLLSSEQEEIKLKNSLNQTKIAKEFAQFLEFV